MSQRVYEPGAGNAPFGELASNPENSNFQNDSALSPTETILLEKDVKRRIFDAAPAQYMALKVLFSKPFMDKKLSEFSYIEKTFDRSVMEASAIAGAVPAVPSTTQTQDIVLTAASLNRASLDLEIIYPNNDKAVISAINTGTNTITVNSISGQGLPAVAVGDNFATMSAVWTDARDHINVYTRTETIERYNYIQQFVRARRWGRFEMQEWMNAGRTDYLEVDRKANMEQLRVDMFNSFWNGERGELVLEDGTSAKTMGGIYPLMKAANAAESDTTIAGFKEAFKALAFTTNYKVEGATRFIYGTDETLHIFAETFKEDKVRYKPMNDTMLNLNLWMITLGTMKFVLVPCELWREPSCFPDSWANRIIVLDQETVRPAKLMGLPSFDTGMTLNMRNNGTLQDYTDWWVRGQLSIEFNNPIGSFIMNIA